MRYLKKYKLFEASWYDIKDHIDVLSDMSMYLWDKEFNVQVADEIISREHQCIVVNIVKKGSNKFTYTEIKQELLEMVGYMDREGWEILNMEFTHIAAGPLYCKLDGDKLVSAVSEEEIDYQFHQLIVKFVEKDITQFEEDKAFISDTLLELQDRGFKIRIGHDGIARSFSITEPMPIFIIDSFKFRVGGRVYFKFSDVKDELLQIKSYLGDRWFKCGVLFEGDPNRIEIHIDEKDYDNLDDWFQTSTTAIVNLAVFFNI